MFQNNSGGRPEREQLPRPCCYDVQSELTAAQLWLSDIMWWSSSTQKKKKTQHARNRALRCAVLFLQGNATRTSNVTYTPPPPPVSPQQRVRVTAERLVARTRSESSSSALKVPKSSWLAHHCHWGKTTTALFQVKPRQERGFRIPHWDCRCLLHHSATRLRHHDFRPVMLADRGCVPGGIGNQGLGPGGKISSAGDSARLASLDTKLENCRFSLSAALTTSLISIRVSELLCMIRSSEDGSEYTWVAPGTHPYIASLLDIFSDLFHFHTHTHMLLFVSSLLSSINRLGLAHSADADRSLIICSSDRD